MAIGDLYANLDQLKNRLDITDTDNDAELTNALLATTLGIELYCERQFNADGGTPRVYRAQEQCGSVLVDDFHGTVVVETDDDDDGTFETMWAAGDVELHPLNGVVAGRPGWPFGQIAAVAARRWPVKRRAAVRVTPEFWGWAVVPAPVVEAALIVSEEIGKLKDAPFGVAGFGEYGAMRVRRNSAAVTMLEPFRRFPVHVGQ